MIPVLWNTLFLAGCLAFFALACVGLIALVAWVMPQDPARQRAIPKGNARERVTDVQIKGAHAQMAAEELGRLRGVRPGNKSIPPPSLPAEAAFPGVGVM